MTSTSLGPWIEQTSMGSRNNPGCAMSYDGRQIILTGFNSPIYRSTNLGVTWTIITNLANGTYIGAASSSDGTKLVINGQGATAGYIFTSTNSGATWTQRLTTGGARAWNSVITSSDGSIIVAAVWSGNIFRSTDSGITWTEGTISNRWSSMASSSNGEKIILGTENVGVYVSSDAGVTWTNKLSGGITGISSSGDGTTMVVYVNGTNPNIVYISNDSGVTWNTMKTFPTLVNKSFSRASSSYDGKILGVAVYNDYVYLSGDSGATWTRQTLGGTRTWTVLSVSPTSNILLAASENNSVYTSTFTTNTRVNTTGIYNIVTKSIGKYWNSKDIVRGWFGVATSSNGKKMIACIHFSGNRLYTSIDSGNTWIINNNLQTGDYTSVSSSADGSILLTGSYAGYLYVSTNSGVTWTQRTANGTRNWWKTGVSSNGTVMVGCPNSGSDGKLYVSTDTGVTWTARLTDAARNWLVAPAFSLDGTKILVADQTGTVGYLWISTDSGTTWTSRLTDSTRSWTGVASSSDGTKLAACVNGGQIWTSINSGTTWTTRGPSVSWTGIVSSSDGTTLAACSTGYIYISTDSGVSWTITASSRSWNCIAASSNLTTLVSTIEGGNIWTSNNKLLVDIGTYLQPYTTGTQIPTGINILNSIKNTGGPSSISPAGSVISYDGSRIVVAVENQSVIYVSTNSGGTWTTYSIGRTGLWRGLSGSSTLDRMILTGGNIGDIDFYSSTNMGVSWTLSSITGTNTRVGANASSADGSKLLVVTQDSGGKIYTSTDSGLTWTMRLTNVSGNWYGAASSADGNNLIAVMYGGYIWTSTDAGISWTQRLTDISAQWNGAGSSADGSVLGAINQSFVYTSTNSGVTWIQYAINRTWYGIAVSGNGNTIAAVNNSNILHFTSNKGVTWKQISMAYTTGQDVAISYDGNIVSVTANNGVYILKVKNDVSTLFNPYTSGPQSSIGLVGTKTLAGDNWTQTSSISASWTHISSSDDGTKLAAASYSSFNIALSTNSGVTWRYIRPGTSFAVGWQVASSSDGSILLAGDNNREAGLAHVYTSTNSGTDWTRRTNGVGSEYWYCMGMSSNGQIMVAIPSTGGWGVIISTNTGNTWNPIPIGFGGWYRSLTVSSSGTTIIAADNNNSTGIFISTNMGVTWTQRTIDGGNWYVTASSDGQKIAACKINGYIYTSIDRGVSWTQRTSSTIKNWNWITSSADGTKLAAVVKNGNIFVSRDSGATWSESTGAGSNDWYGIASSANGSKLAAVANNTSIFISSSVLSDVGNIFQNNINVAQYTSGVKRLVYNVYFNKNVAFDIGLTPSSIDSNVIELATYVSGAYTYVYTGYFLPDFTGNWTFNSGASDDASYLWIGPNANSGYTTANANLYSNWDIGTTPTAVVFLTSGQYYPIRIIYGGAGGTNSYFLEYSRNGSANSRNFSGKLFDLY